MELTAVDIAFGHSGGEGCAVFGSGHGGIIAVGSVIGVDKIDAVSFGNIGKNGGRHYSS